MQLAWPLSNSCHGPPAGITRGGLGLWRCSCLGAVLTQRWRWEAARHLAHAFPCLCAVTTTQLNILVIALALHRPSRPCTGWRRTTGCSTLDIFLD